MNVRIDQLKTTLASGLHPVYFVSGDEPLQAMEAADLIRVSCRDQGYVEREVFEVDAKFDWQFFSEAAASMSLFSSRRVLDVRLPSASPGKQGSQAIQQYLENPPEDTVLLITSGKIDKAKKNSAWYRAIDKSGVAIQCWPVSQENLASWVRQRFQSRGMQVDKEVVDYVCQHVEGNLLAAAQEIDKLQLLLGSGINSGPIGFDSVREAITDNSRYSVFELADAALQGDRSRVMKIINSLNAEGMEPILLIWALAKEIRLLRNAAAEPSTAEYTLSRSGVWKNRMGLFRACLSRHTEKSLQLLLQRCAMIDGISKGFEQGNAWDELRMLCFRLAGGKRPARI
jgi:DNA polymerase-3 subunit delta